MSDLLHVAAEAMLRAMSGAIVTGGVNADVALDNLRMATEHATAIGRPRAGMSDEDRERRRQTLGSSEIAAICGVNPYQSAHQVWMSKVRGVDFEGNEATILGNILEPTIFSIYADRYNRTLRKGTYTVGREPWMSATPDANIVGGGLVEAKLVGLRSIFMWGPGNSDAGKSDQVPMHYLTQAQWQMAVTGESFVDIAALMGTEFRSYTIESNATLQAQLIERGREFWERYVLTKTPPPIDGSEGCTQMLKTLYPRGDGAPVTADERLERLAEQLRVARAAADKAAEAKAKAENEIKAALEEAPAAYGKGWRIRFAKTKKGSRPFYFEETEGGKAA